MIPWGGPWSGAFRCEFAHNLMFCLPCMNPVVLFRVSFPDCWKGGMLKCSFFVLGRLDRVFQSTSCNSNGGGALAPPRWLCGPGGPANGIFCGKSFTFLKSCCWVFMENGTGFVYDNLQPYFFRISLWINTLTSYYFNNHIKSALWRFSNIFFTSLSKNPYAIGV